jgi:hypothetical protein
VLPAASSGIPPAGGVKPAVNPAAQRDQPQLVVDETEWLQTVPDTRTGLYRRYPHAPTCDPDQTVPLSELCDSPEITKPSARRESWWSGMTASLAGFMPSGNIFAPLLNATQFHVMEWHYNRADGTSNANTNSFLADVCGAPGFKLEDTIPFRVEKGEALLDGHERFAKEDGWVEATLEIPIPHTGVKASEEDAARFSIPGFFYRRLVPIITSFFASAPRNLVHYTPFELFQQLADGTSERIFTEVYNSTAWITEHLQIQRAFQGQMRGAAEIAIAAILLYSDSTHLAQFGTKSAWPIYAFFANESKHTQNKPSMFSAQHIGYIPSVSARKYSII